MTARLIGPRQCRHPDRRLVHLDSWSSRCGLCGMHWAMVGGLSRNGRRLSVQRRWLKPDDPRLADSEATHEVALAVLRGGRP